MLNPRLPCHFLALFFVLLTPSHSFSYPPLQSTKAGSPYQQYFFCVFFPVGFIFEEGFLSENVNCFNCFDFHLITMSWQAIHYFSIWQLFVTF